MKLKNKNPKRNEIVIISECILLLCTILSIEILKCLSNLFSFYQKCRGGLQWGEKDTKRDTHRYIYLCLWISSSYCFSSQMDTAAEGYTREKTGGRNFTWVSHMSDKDPSTRGILCFSQAIAGCYFGSGPTRSQTIAHMRCWKCRWQLPATPQNWSQVAFFYLDNSKGYLKLGLHHALTCVSFKYIFGTISGKEFFW